MIVNITGGFMEEDEKILSKENDIEHTSKQSWFKRHKKLLIFLGVLIVIGLTIGIAAVTDGLRGIEVLGNFITDQILGMQWMNTLLGMAFTGIFGMEFTATRWGGAIQFFIYDKKAVEQEPEMMIELLVEKVYVYSDDRIEIMLHYVDTPITPKPIEYDKDESPEGESLRGSLIYTTKIFVDNDIFKGMNKKILEPAFKETQKMPVLIEIRG